MGEEVTWLEEILHHVVPPSSAITIVGDCRWCKISSFHHRFGSQGDLTCKITGERRTASPAKKASQSL